MKKMVMNNLKWFREIQGLSQRELAEKINVSRNVINNIENNVSQPSLEQAEKLAECFGGEIYNLFRYRYIEEEK